MSTNHDVSLLDMSDVRIDPAWALRIPPALALRRLVLPFACVGDRVHVACADPSDLAALEAVERFVGKSLCLDQAKPDSLRRAVQRVFGTWQSGQSGEGRSPLLRVGGDHDATDAVAACDELLYAAFVYEASDIHIDPGPDQIQIRLRVDGVLEPYRTFSSGLLSGLISRFKVLAGMDIAERRAPQDGGFSQRFGSAQVVDIRVATLPTKYGERMTLRLLALQTENLTVERLGMAANDLAIFEQQVDMPHGMILLSGPTGSGKTTTLYAALRRLIGQQVGNVITVEDPIEYAIPGVAQVEVDSADKVNFSRALRSLLRHDPDVVMIGEIRDFETADVAIKASLTGHLVFSTLHTNSAAGVVTRLIDMGVDRYLIAATLRLAVSQRLVRRLCQNCRRPRELTTPEAAALRRLEHAGKTVYEPGGCKYCANRGFAGRFGLFELLPNNEQLSRQIVQGAAEADLVSGFCAQGGRLLLDDAAEKLFDGRTTVKEVLNAVATW